MAHLIDKDALVAEIERLENKNCKNSNDFNLGAATYLGMLKQFINTHEVKEVDLEKEVDTWRHNHFHGRRDKEASGEYLKRVSQLDLAQYFFELGLKAQKGE